MADEDHEALSAEEVAYFDNRGEKSEPEKPALEAEKPSDVDDPELEEEIDDPDSQPESDEKKPARKVPLKDLQNERVKRQEAQKRERELSERYARLEERTNLITQAIQARNQPEPVKQPALEEDPIAVIRNLQQQVEQQSQRAQQDEAQRREAEQISTIDNTYRGDWQRFAQAKPDAMDAYNHFTKILATHFQLRGANPQEQAQLIANEERQIAVRAFQQGKSPAELIYEQAKGLGWQPKPAATEHDPNTATEQIERKKAALPAARSMSNTGGSSSGATPTPEQIANMSEAAFEEFYNKLSPAKRERLLGA